MVDDDQHLLLLSETVLNKLGYNVISYSNSTHALEMFRELPALFDLVITDYRMPGRNGAELSREFLKINENIPIIICAGDESIVDEEEIESCGATLFIRKPFLKQDFINLVTSAINGRNM